MSAPAQSDRGYPPAVPGRRNPLAALLSALAVLVAAVLVVVGTGPAAQAATIQEVTGFGSNPGNVQMFRYVPDGLPSGRPVVVAMHGCGMNGPGYGANAGWTRLADAHRFSVVLPQQRSANNANSCFTWFENGDITRGSGEALSIKQMVDRMRADVGASTAYVTGLSAGGGMTAVMLATYPEVFAGGGIVAGIPYRCGIGVGAAFGCMNPGVNRTPAQWGDLVRGASSNSGRWPKVSIWHGTADSTVRPANLTEAVEQWTNVHGTDQTPDVSDTVAGYPHRVYGSVVETYEITGMGHGTPVDPGSGATQCGTASAYVLDVNICSSYHMARFWGLISGPAPTTTNPTTPAPACVTASNAQHVAAGRAYARLGYAHAAGSDQNLGLNNYYYSSTLKQTGPGYWVKC